jgi:hypothetical protein
MHENPLQQPRDSEQGPDGRVASATVPEVEQAIQRQLGPFLQQVKQMTLEVIDEVGRKHANPLLAQLRQTLAETIAALLKAEVPALLNQLKPAVLEGSDAFQQKTDKRVKELKEFITRTVSDVFRVHVPEYSSRAGHRMMVYLLAGTLFCLGAVVGCVGMILGLERAGLPGYATYLVGGGVAVAAGVLLLRAYPKKGTGTLKTQRPFLG